MENDRLRPEEIEREDIRTFPRSLRRLFQPQKRILQEYKGRDGKESRTEKALCEKAEALKDSTDWKSTTER